MCYVKCKQSRLSFELVSLCPTMITITPQVPRLSVSGKSFTKHFTFKNDPTFFFSGNDHLYVTSVCIYPTPQPEAGCDTRSIFKLVKASLNSKFSFPNTGCLTKAKESSLSYYLPIASGGEKKWIYALPKGVSAKGNAVLSWIWTRVTNSIFFNNNRYTKHISFLPQLWVNR